MLQSKGRKQIGSKISNQSFRKKRSRKKCLAEAVIKNKLNKYILKAKLKRMLSVIEEAPSSEEITASNNSNIYLLNDLSLIQFDQSDDENYEVMEWQLRIQRSSSMYDEL